MLKHKEKRGRPGPQERGHKTRSQGYCPGGVFASEDRPPRRAFCYTVLSVYQLIFVSLLSFCSYSRGSLVWGGPETQAGTLVGGATGHCPKEE